MEAVVVFGLASIFTMSVGNHYKAYMTLGVFCVLHLVCALLNICAIYARKVCCKLEFFFPIVHKNFLRIENHT